MDRVFDTFCVGHVNGKGGLEAKQRRQRAATCGLHLTDKE